MEPYNKCSICLENHSNYKLKICKHKFHKRCIKRWVKDHHSCPLCRQSVVNSFTIWLVINNTNYNISIKLFKGIMLFDWLDNFLVTFQSFWEDDIIIFLSY